MRLLRTLLLAFLVSGSLSAHTEEIPPGSELRRQLFDSIRPKAEEMSGRPVKFVGHLREQDGWAWFQGALVDGKGKAIMPGEAESSDAIGLWKREGKGLKLVSFEAGFTDVFYMDYPQRYGVPQNLLFPGGIR